METNTNRYRSRILREMHQNTKNPFNSPPSSTGSHGTVTLTSDISLGPGADSMPRFEASKRATDDTDDRAMAFNINTSVLGRTFPEWANYKHTGPVHDLTEDLYDATADFPRDETKENIPPASSSTIASPSQIVDDQQRFLHSKTRDARERRESLKATPETPAPAVSAAHKTTTKSRGANVTTLLDNLRTAQEKYGLSQSSKESTPEPAAKATQPSPHNKTSNAARSFLVPDLSIMNDFVSGTLRLSTLRNGVPIFVKNGKVHDREAATTPAKHHAVEAVEVPQDEEEIFVSLDKIREEIGALQEHDAMVSEKAQKLQEEVDELWISLHAQAGPHKNGKGSTEADQALIKQLKQDKNHLQEQLDKANRKIKIVELRAEDSSAAKEAAERERDSAIRDCDRALQTAAQDARRCEQAEDQLASAKRALKDVQDENTHGLGQLESENLRLQQNNESLRAEVQSLEHKLQKQSNDLEKLKVTNQIMSDDLITAKAKHNDKCQSSHTIQLQLEKTADDKAQLENDVRQLEHVRQYFERTNTKLEGDKQTLVEDIVILKEQVAVLQKTTAEQEQEISALHEDISTLQALLDEANNMTEDATDVRSRMESQKRILEQKIISLESAVRRSRANAANSEALFEDVRKQESQLEALNRKLMNENADMQQRLSVAQAELDFGPELPLEDHIDDVVDGLQDGMRRFSGKHTKVLDKQQAPLAEQFLSLIKSEARLTRKRKEGENRPNTSPEDEEEAQQNTVTLTKIREMRTEVVCQMLKGYAGQGKAKPAKVTRIVSPAADATKSYTAETAGRSPTSTTGFPLQDDFTREIDLEQPSPSASRMAPTQRLSQQHKTTAFHGVYAESDDGMTGEPSQSLPPLFFADQPRGNMPKGTDPGRPVRNTTKTQPVGILKNKSAQFDLANDQDTGRFSVKSGVSGMSIFSNASVTNMFQRPTSAIGRSDVDTHEENMTSALFVDDITIDTRKKSNKLQMTKKISAVPVLSKTAQRVLASLCDEHDCGNCNVCMRINSHSHKSVPGQEPKQKIRVSKPIAVTDRIPNSTVTSTAQHEDEHTIRPASNPAVALAAVMKGLKDEEQHIIAVLSKAEKELKSLDASHSRRHRKALKEEVQRLHRELDVKRDQIYMLHDVLEGQKASGEEMTADYVEYTIQSIMGAEETWDGIQA